MHRVISTVAIIVTGALWLGFLTGLAEAQEPTPVPAPTDSESLAKSFNLWTVAAQAVLTSVAIVAGGIFAWRRGYIFRLGQPHLTIAHDVTHRQVSPGYTHIEVTATLHNRSRVKVEIRNGLFTIQQIAPTTDEDVENLYAQTFDRGGRYQDLGWRALEEIPRVWNKNELIAEPGESVTATFEYIVPDYVRSVLLTTYFYNLRVMGKIDDHTYPPDAQRRSRLWLWKVSGPRGWTRTTAHDMLIDNGRVDSKTPER